MSLFLANFKFVEAHLLDQIANKSVRNLLGILISTNSTIIYTMNYVPVSTKIILHDESLMQSGIINISDGCVSVGNFD